MGGGELGNMDEAKNDHEKCSGRCRQHEKHNCRTKEQCEAVKLDDGSNAVWDDSAENDWASPKEKWPSIGART